MFERSGKSKAKVFFYTVFIRKLYSHRLNVYFLFQEQRKASRQPTPNHSYTNGYVRQPGQPHPPQPHAQPPPQPPHGQHYGARAAGAAPFPRSRDYRRERYSHAHYERRPHLDRSDLRHGQPDYTQVNILYCFVNLLV